MNHVLINQLNIVVTDKCYSLCQHCGFSCNYNDCVHFDTKLFNSTVRQAAKLGIETVDLSGGEPTLHPYFTNMLEQLIDLSFKRISIATNLHDTDKLLSVFSNTSKLKLSKLHLRISLDGANGDQFDWLRGPGSFENLIHRLKKVSKYILPHSATTLLHKNNYQSLSDISRLAREIGCQKHNLISILPFGRGYTFQKYQVDNGFWFLKLPSIVSTLNNLHGLDYNILGPIGEPLCSIAMNINRPYGVICSVSGEVFPDCFYQYFKVRKGLGTLGVDDIETMIKKAREYSIRSTPSCKKCNLRYVCFGLFINKKDWCI
jgi:MoaA/NifB/PqqE/SkfB family radical SAM enzyme